MLQGHLVEHLTLWGNPRCATHFAEPSTPLNSAERLAYYQGELDMLTAHNVSILLFYVILYCIHIVCIIITYVV